jgi:hypothetical protein
MVLRVPVHQDLHAGDVLAPVRDVLDAVHALGRLAGQRGRALVGRDSLLVDEVDADFFVDVYGPGVGREKTITVAAPCDALQKNVALPEVAATYCLPATW